MMPLTFIKLLILLVAVLQPVRLAWWRE